MSTVETPVIDVDWNPPKSRERVRYQGGLRTPTSHYIASAFKRPWFKYAIILHDLLIGALAMVAAVSLKQESIPVPGDLLPASPESYFFMAIFAGIFPVLLKINGLYKIHVFTSIRTQFRFASKALAEAFFLLIIGEIILEWMGWPAPGLRDSLVYCLLICGFFLGSRIFIVRTLFRILASQGVISRSVLIIGAGPRGRTFADSLRKADSRVFRIAGFLDDTQEIGTPVLAGAGVVGRFNDVERIVKDRHIKEIVICLDNDSVPDLFEKIDRCSQTSALVMVSSPAYDIISKKLAQECYGTMPVVGVNNFNKTAYAGMPLLKRVVDILIASLALILLSPLLLIVMAAIKLESKGPVLYKQTRVGKDGKLFTFFKFRSMTVGADADPSREENYAKLIKGTWNPTSESNPSKIMNTSAVTRIGKIIRKLSIDEVPQLIHVIKGEMSIVGPRPCIPYEWKHYEPWHRRRFSAMPGCTGLWQVFGRSKVSFNDMVILDVFYSQNISFHMDIWLMLKTLPVMIFGRGAR